jgi:hypothetical protein
MTDSSSKTETGRRATEADCDSAIGREWDQVTPEMVTAGLRSFGKSDPRFESDEEMVREIFISMMRCLVGTVTETK